MKKKMYIIAVFAALAASTFSAQAQIGDLRNKVRQKKGSQQSDNNSSSSGSSDNSSSGGSEKSSGGSEERPSKNKGEEASSAPAGPVQVDWKQHPLPATVELWSILDEGFRMDLEDAFPRTGIINIAFLPTKTASGGDLFDKTPMPKDRATPLYGQVKDKGGALVYKQVLTPLTGQTPVTPVNKDDFFDAEIAKRDKPFAAGDYTFEVILGDRTIFSMPFEIIVGKNDDPYAKVKEIRMIDGYWSKYGCYKFDKSSENFIFYTWETNKNMKLKDAVNEDMKYTYEAQLFYNGQPFSSLEKNSNSIFRGKWQDVHTTFHPIADKNGSSYLKKDDFKDGSYVMKVKFNGKDREYPFKVKDGKHVNIDEQDKAKTPDLAKLFEGTNRTFWVKNVK